MASKITVPTYNEKISYTGGPSRSYSLGGEKVSPLRIDFVPDTKKKSIAKAYKTVGKQFYEAERAEDISKGIAAMTERENALLYASKNKWQHLSIPQHEEMFSDSWDRNSDAVLDSIANPQARKALAQRFRIEKASAASKALYNARNHFVDLTISTAEKNIDDYSEDYIRQGLTDPKAAFTTLEKINLEIDKLITNGVITKTKGEATRRSIEDKLEFELVKQMIDKNPSDAYGYLTEEEKSEEGININLVFDRLDVRKKDDILSYAEAQRDAELNREISEDRKADAKTKRDRRIVEEKLTWKLFDKTLTEADLQKVGKARSASPTRLLTLQRELLRKDKKPNDKATMIALLDMELGTKDGYIDSLETAFDSGAINLNTYLSKKKTAGNKLVSRNKSKIKAYFNPRAVEFADERAEMEERRSRAIAYFEEGLLNLDKLEQDKVEKLRRQAVDEYTTEKIITRKAKFDKKDTHFMKRKEDADARYRERGHDLARRLKAKKITIEEAKKEAIKIKEDYNKELYK